jgi:hypothetical protein
MPTHLLTLTTIMLLAGAKHATASPAESEPGSAPLEAGERVERVPTRDGVEVPVLVREPTGPALAIALLYPGGGGHLALSKTGIGKGANNFMVRTRAKFAAAGLVTIVVDAPSDHHAGLTTFRSSEEQAQDCAKLLAWAHERWHAPTWLIGTSRGTISAAAGPARGVVVAGLVLTSSVTAGKHGTLLDLPLANIAVPTLLVHHEHDACRASPLAGARELPQLMAAAHCVALETFSGGDEPQAGACSPSSQHGFLGLDDEVVASIVKFVRAH